MSKRVREEVALGVAEVGAVEPDVGLVEDAVERQPVAPPSAGPARARTACGRSAAPSLPAKSGEVAPVAGTATIGPRRRRGVEPDSVAAQLVVGNIGAPLSREIHRRRD